MQLPPIIQQLDRRLLGLPDNILTIILIALGIFALIIALRGKPVYKAALAAWFIAP